MKFHIGDSVLAYKDTTGGRLVGIVFKASDVSSPDHPNRCVISVRFQNDPAIAATFVYTGSEESRIWFLPSTTYREAVIAAIHRGAEIVWTE